MGGRIRDLLAASFACGKLCLREALLAMLLHCLRDVTRWVRALLHLLRDLSHLFFTQLDENRAAIRIQQRERERKARQKQELRQVNVPAWKESKMQRDRIRLRSAHSAPSLSSASKVISTVVPIDSNGAPKLPHGRAPPKLMKFVQPTARWWNNVPAPSVAAATRFDTTHFDNVSRACKLELVARGGKYRQRCEAAIAFGHSVNAIRHTRYFRGDEATISADVWRSITGADVPVAHRGRSRKREEFDVGKSIWAPRNQWCAMARESYSHFAASHLPRCAIHHSPQLLSTASPPHPLLTRLPSPVSSFPPAPTPQSTRCDSKSLLDTEAAALQRFENDFNRMLDLGLAKLVTRSDDDAGLDTDGDGRSDEVEEVEAVLWAHHSTLFNLFTFYACLGNDMHSLYLNQWSLLLEDYHLVSNSSKLCKKADMDRLFIAVDARAAKLASSGVWKHQAAADKKKALSRVEFTTALVHIAVSRYVLTREVSDVSEALEKMIQEDILPRIDPRVMCETNDFRERYCYTEAASLELKKHEPLLRAVFKQVYSCSHASRCPCTAALCNEIPV